MVCDIMYIVMLFIDGAPGNWRSMQDEKIDNWTMYISFDDKRFLSYTDRGLQQSKGAFWGKNSCWYE